MSEFIRELPVEESAVDRAVRYRIGQSAKGCQQDESFPVLYPCDFHTRIKLYMSVVQQAVDGECGARRLLFCVRIAALFGGTY